MKPLVLARCFVILALIAAGAATATAQTAVPEPGVVRGPTVVRELPEAVEPITASPAETISTLFVFMLATFVGLDVIRRVSRLLHTPLMSLTNAISAIAVVGSILVAGRRHASFAYNVLGLVAIAASVTNIVSGFLITDRMLKMFKRRSP